MGFCFFASTDNQKAKNMADGEHFLANAAVWSIRVCYVNSV